MLAVQRSSMGSSKPPNLDMPFGYNFDTSDSNYPFPSPTAPAPGPSLLDDNESKFLDSFFDGVSNDHFNYDFFTNPPDGSELALGWNELPPTFMGTTSSFGQQPVIGHHGLPEQQYSDINSQMNLGPAISTSTPADILAAATLLQNGPSGRPHNMANGNLFAAQDVSTQHVNGNLRPHSVLHYPSSRPTHGLPQRGGGNYMRDNYYRDMVFGSDPDPTLQQRRVSNQKVDIQWGSDVGFGSPQGFVSALEQQRIIAVERSHIETVEGALTLDTSQLASSAENTRPSSPAHTGHQQRTKLMNHEDDTDSRPRKRRKSKFVEDEEETESPLSATAKQNDKKRKPAKKGGNESPEADQGHKRRKSAAANAAAAAAKATRENLTEDQKRENHIKSEQKRRTLIREGFEDLGELVPGLKGGGFSKSAVLTMAADWLEELIQGNRELQGKLDQMEGRR